MFFTSYIHLYCSLLSNGAFLSSGKSIQMMEQSPHSRECQKDVIKFEKNEVTPYTANGRGVKSKLLIQHFVHVHILLEK
jgi:hypothetical protein